MPAYDRYHDAVRAALVKDGWVITHDPLRIHLRSGRNLFVDLGAEQLLGAEKGRRKIAVEIKSFLGQSDVHDLEVAVGQFVVYSQFLKRYEPDRELHLAIPEPIRRSMFEEEIGRTLLDAAVVRVVSFDPHTEVLVQWMP